MYNIGRSKKATAKVLYIKYYTFSIVVGNYFFTSTHIEIPLSAVINEKLKVLFKTF